ncbi:sigma-70 family RNA polymerase sigma factor [Corynebacterium xerosis]|uniref:sigma-70 family RNA polymerase sigma factor n=1 Tax=Corynebacterium xerosis TaxID=1725 RepID=UPI0027B8D602|nr:sigma-70 family RNA polymerase sigma factor [Corynebacterium xerosis]
MNVGFPVRANRFRGWEIVVGLCNLIAGRHGVFGAAPVGDGSVAELFRKSFSRYCRRWPACTRGAPHGRRTGAAKKGVPVPTPIPRGDRALRVLSEGELIDQIAGGDWDAFAELYDRFGARVYGMALRVVVDPKIAEDVAQDAWLAIWDSAASFDPTRGSAAGWALAIAHRRAVDAVRSIDASRRRADAAADRDAARPVGGGADEDVLADHERREVADCLGTLSELQREALDLAYFGGMTQKEISRRLGTGLSAVKSRIRDGLIALRRCLGE